jgi:hypothetical protein
MKRISRDSAPAVKPTAVQHAALARVQGALVSNFNSVKPAGDNAPGIVHELGSDYNPDVTTNSGPLGLW